MFRKDNPAISEWSPANVSACAERQMEIVRDVWPALTDGGYLIYSTCTYNPEENEHNVERICKELGAEAVEIPVNESWGITGNLLTGASFPVYHFLPSRSRGEGFFLALIRKKGEKRAYDTRLKKQEALAPLKKSLSSMLNGNDGWLQWDKEDLTFALPDCMGTDFRQLSAACHILSAGIPVATHKGGKLVPHHALSLSTHLNRKAFPTIEINRDNALNYLRRLSLTLPAETERGYVLLTYQGFSLGFVNNLGNRANNLYPQNWKIRSSHATDMVNGFIRSRL